MKKVKVLLALVCICLLFSGGVTPNMVISKKIIISDIKHWKHPVKKVFENNDMDLDKVELLNNKKYPIFYLSFISEYKAGFNFLNEVAKENSYNDYEIVYDYADYDYVKVFCNHKNKKIVKAIKHYNDGAEDTIEYIFNLNKKNNLDNKDFELYFKKYKISKDINIDEFISKFGYGNANENNNMGYIGKGDDGYNRNGFGYEDGNNYIRLIILNINEMDGGLERIDVEKTYRNLQNGDSVEKLIKIYGQPNFIVNNKGKESEYVYRYSDRELRLNIYQAHVVNISLQFNNLYKF